MLTLIVGCYMLGPVVQLRVGGSCCAKFETGQTFSYGQQCWELLRPLARSFNKRRARFFTLKKETKQGKTYQDTLASVSANLCRLASFRPYKGIWIPEPEIFACGTGIPLKELNLETH